MVRIMLVEDEMILLHAMQVLLAKEFGEDIRIISASDEDEAIGKIFDDCPEVVISDLRMKSKRGGLKLCEYVKEINPGTFFILCTGSKRDLENERACWDELIEKPFDRAGLINVLCKHVQF
jgi:DNA-binding NtrC family response regulator